MANADQLVDKGADQVRPSVDHVVDPNKHQADSAWSLLVSTAWCALGLHLVFTVVHEFVFI